MAPKLLLWTLAAVMLITADATTTTSAPTTTPDVTTTPAPSTAAPETTTAASAPGTTTAAPAPGTTTAASAPGTTTAAPAPGTTTLAPAAGTTTAAPAPSTAAPAATTAAPAPSTAAPAATTAAPAPSTAAPAATTAAPAPSTSGPGATTAAPAGVTTAAPAPGATTAAPAPGATTAAPGPGATTAAPGPSATTAAPAPGATTAASAPGATTAAPAPGTTTPAPLQDICLDVTNPAANEHWISTGSIESFSSGQYPNNYGSSDSQEWVFCAMDATDRIVISCSDFFVGGFIFGCLDDTLTITNTDASTSEFCYNNGPQLVKTTVRGTKVTFNALTTGLYKGFTCTAQAVRSVNCRSALDRASYEIWIPSGQSESFTSPNAPSNYGSKDSKNWVFCAVDPLDFIQISCSDFNVGGVFFDGCTDDAFTISNTVANGKFCSTNTPRFVDTVGRATEVTLSVKSTFGYPGFSCTATAVRTPCLDPANAPSGEVWLANGAIEYFTSPNYPSNYPQGNVSQWVFCANDAIDRIEISCDDFQVGGNLFRCLDDSFLISNVKAGSSKFCGITRPTDVMTNQRSTRVIHDVSAGQNYKGFNCSAEATRPEICMDPTNPAANEIWLDSGESTSFTSANYPSNYDSESSEEWVFCAVQDTEKISFRCSGFSVGFKAIFCFDDFLTISNVPFGIYCGWDGPQNLVTTERGSLVSLSVSPIGHYPGFNCTATAVA